MSYPCFACKAQATTVEFLLAHIQVRHKTLNIFRCTSPNCLRAFNTFKSFKSHFKKDVHEPVTRPTATANVIPFDGGDLEMLSGTGTEGVPPASPPEIEMAETLDTEHSPSLYELRQEVSDGALRLAANLYSNTGMTRAAVQNVIEGVSHFVDGEHMSFVKSNIVRLMEENNVPPDAILKANVLFEAVSNPFAGLETEHLRIEALKETDMYVKPERYVIGSEYVTKKVNQISQLAHVDLYGQRVRMKEVLCRFLQLPGALNEILSYYDNLMATDEPFINIVQGTLWKRKVEQHFQGKRVLPLALATDDFDPDNTLGSHGGDHKICAVYFAIACLPPECAYRLENLFLGSFFLSENKVFGNEKVFKPIVDDLYELETAGLEINGETIYFCLCAILGDNLGLHEILGFRRGFRAKFPCRMCRVSSNVLISQFYVDPSLLRNSENYAADLVSNKPTETGIAERCIFSKLPSYGDPTKNPYCDFLHDVCEGIAKYDMGEILRYIVIGKKMLSLTTLNERIRNFDYSGVEEGNVVPIIAENHLKEKHIKMSSSEMLTFVRYLSVMIGDYVPKDDPVWKFYLTLREVVDILTAPSVNRNLTNYLRVLIAEHHEQYVTLFGENLKPKYHFLLHYPDVQLEIGPVIRVWTARCESKHRPSKQNAHLTNSRKNLILTLAIKHQLDQCNRFFSQLPLCSGVPICGPVVPHIYLENSQLFPEFSSVLPRSFLDRCPTEINWVQVNGTKYEHEMVAVVGFSRELPRFGVIKHIFVVDKVPYFILSILSTTGFDSHLYCFPVRFTKKWKCISQEKLVTFQPLKMISLPRTGEKVVVTRFQL